MPRKQPPSEVLSKVSSLKEYDVQSIVHVATLWSNYGSIDRVSLKRKPGSVVNGENITSVVVKTVAPPSLPTGASKDEGNIRKLLSYEVEQWFYRNLSTKLSNQAKVAVSYPIQEDENQTQPVQLVLEDLSIDYPNPARGSLNLEETFVVLRWLAQFHATFWQMQVEGNTLPGVVPPPPMYQGGEINGIWEQGTYWYLDTRKEELDSVDEDEYGWLLKWTHKVDDAMKSEAKEYGTLLHGDAKGANIVFSKSPRGIAGQPLSCALYDFQYTGIGIVTRDLVYFLGTTAQSGIVRRKEQEFDLLRTYHTSLLDAIGSRITEAAEKPDLPSDPQSAAISPNHQNRGDIYSFERFQLHWELAIVDWYRFMAGWGFWGNDSWIEQRTREIVSEWERNGGIFDTDSTEIS